MKSLNIDIPGLNAELDSGRWDGYPPDSPDSPLESVLGTPDENETLHAPIWQHHSDPERFLAEERVKSSLCFTEEVDSLPPAREPFAILGGRHPFYLGLNSPGAYQKFIQTDHDNVPKVKRETRRDLHDPKSAIPSTPPTTGNTSCPIRAEQCQAQSRRPLSPVQRPTSPVKLNAPHARDFRPKARNSALSFFAVWDPEANGMTTFADSHLLNNPTTRPQRGPALPSHPKIRSQESSPLSPLCEAFSPGASLSSIPTCDRKRSGIYSISRTSEHACGPFSMSPDLAANDRTSMRYDQSGNKKARRNFHIVDDEGFFETPELSRKPEGLDALSTPGHDDCEPHLPSRFSISTTSTSNYVDLDFPPELSTRKVALGALDRHTKAKKKAHILEDSQPTRNSWDSHKGYPRPTQPELIPMGSPTKMPGGNKSRSAKSSFLGKLKLSSKAHREGWVNVEVMTVVKEE